MIVIRGKRSAEPSIAAVTSFYNYAGFNSLRENYLRFSAEWAASKIPLYTVECLLPGQSPSLPDAPNLHRVTVADPFIHKESAINWMVPQIPAQYRQIVWTDCDYLFDDFAPFRRLPSLLTQQRAVQCISKLDYIDRRGIAFARKTAFAATPDSGGFHGGTWAADRSLWDSWGGLYSGSALGGHDTVSLMSFYGPERFGAWTSRRHPAFRKEILDFCSRQSNHFAGRVGCLDVCASHLYHGQLANRRYVDKHTLVKHLPPGAFRRDAKGFLEFNRAWLRNTRRYSFERDRLALLDYYRERAEDD
jgi:hypothetical protein